MKKSRLIVVLKGYPRVDELFIAQELVELERKGHELLIFALLKPESSVVQSIHKELKAQVVYVPRVTKKLCLSTWRYFIRRPIKCLEVWLQYRVQAVVGEKCDKRFFQALWISQYLGDNPDGVLYTHNINIPALVGMGVSLLTELPWFAFAHAKDIYCSERKFLELRLNRVRCVFSCNRESANYLLMIHPRVKLVYHGIREDHFINQTQVKRELPHFIVMARLVAKKGHLFLLDVLNELKKSGVQFSCSFYGEGELQSAIEKRIQTYELEKNVTLHGAYRVDEMASQIAKGDFYLGPFFKMENGDRDGIPNTMLEAMYLQCVVVSHQSEAISEVLTDGENGYFVAPNIEAWVSKLKKLIGTDQTQIAQMARQTVEERFLFKHCVEELTDTFDNI